MLQKEVKDWLAEYKGLAASEIHTFANSLAANEDLVVGLYDLFETTPFYVQELDPVCHQLYEFYRSKEKRLVLFSLQFVPVLTWLYLRCLSFQDKKNSGGVETFLLGVYNLEIVTADGSQKVDTFRIPCISESSLYHESRIVGGTGELLTQHNLRQLNNVHGVWRCGPFKQYERFNAQNRFSILSHLMLVFNNEIDKVHSLSLEALCRVTIRLSSTGFVTALDGEQNNSRIGLHPSLLIELLAGVYFALFNGHCNVAMSAVEAAHERARYELFSDVLLVTNGLLNSHKSGRFTTESGKTAKSIQDRRKKTSVMRSFITNASFKAKKLPDDIEIVDEESSSRGGHLATLDEESVGVSPGNEAPSSLAKGLKARLMTKLSGDRGKNKDNSVAMGIGKTDVTWNNAGKKDNVEAVSIIGQGFQPQSPGGVGVRVIRQDNDGDMMPESVGQAAEALGVCYTEGADVTMDVLEMEAMGQAGGDSDYVQDLYPNQVSQQQHQHPIRHNPRQRQRPDLFSPPETPTPTSAPAHSPLGTFIRRSSTQHGANTEDSQSAQHTALNGKPGRAGEMSSNGSTNGTSIPNVSFSTSSTSRHSKGVSNSSSYTMMAGDIVSGSQKCGSNNSQSGIAPNLAYRKSPPPSFYDSTSSSHVSPRDAFFDIPNPTASNPPQSPNSPPGQKPPSATKVNRNSYSTDL